MFSASAEWYDHIYRDKPYAEEAEHIAAIVATANPSARSLLDVACGTGRHLECLRDRFTCEGVDVDERLLAIAGARLPGLPLSKGDMRHLNLGRQFDAITCLFSAIGYMLSVAELRLAVASMARHLTPCGVLIVEPWILPEQWTEPGTAMLTSVEVDGTLFVRVVASLRSGDETELRMHYVKAKPGCVEKADELHRLRLHSKDDYLAAFAAAGLAPVWDRHGLAGRGLVIGRASG